MPLAGSKLRPSFSQYLRSDASPTPGRSPISRKKLISSCGFSKSRRNDSTSFTCSCSNTPNPLVMRNGTRARVSASWMSIDVKCDRYRMAISL